MRTLRLPLALAVALGALLSSSLSFADETRARNTTSSAPPARSTTTTTSSPYVRSADRGERVVETRPNPTLLQTGAGMFALSYGGSVAAGLLSDRDADKRLLIPVAGPWMDLGDRGCSLTTPCGEGEGLTKVLLVTSGIAQGASVVLMLGSLVIPEVKVESNTAGVKVLPMSFASGAGLAAVGRF